MSNADHPYAPTHYGRARVAAKSRYPGDSNLQAQTTSCAIKILGVHPGDTVDFAPDDEGGIVMTTDVPDHARYARVTVGHDSGCYGRAEIPQIVFRLLGAEPGDRLVFAPHPDGVGVSLEGGDADE